MKILDLNEIPLSVRLAAYEVHTWTVREGYDNWQLMDLCSRRYAFALAAVKAALNCDLPGSKDAETTARALVDENRKLRSEKIALIQEKAVCDHKLRQIMVELDEVKTSLIAAKVSLQLKSTL